MAGELRTCAPEGSWSSFPYTVPSGATKVIGTLYLINDTWAVCFASEDNHLGDETDGDSIAAGKEVSMIYKAEKITVDKATGAAIAVGEKVYVAPTTKEVSATKDATYTTCIGIAVEPATSAATEVIIELNGDSMTDQA
jgi:predicted RecA/RadA family phage recombinase